MSLGDPINISIIDYDKLEDKSGYHRVIYHGQSICYRKNDKLHCLDGPALISDDGYRSWAINGIHHRDDGPAVILADGTKFYWLNGKIMSREDWFDSIPEDKLNIALSNPENF